MNPRILQRFAAGAMMVSLAGGALAADAKPAKAKRYSDVKPGHWAAGSIDRLSAKGVLDGFPKGGQLKGQKPLTRYEAAALVDRVMAELERKAAAPAPPPPATEVSKLKDEVARLKAASARAADDVGGVRDDLEFHLKKDRQEKEKRGRTTFFGVGEFCYTLTDSEANLSPIVRFPYDWDQTPLAGVTGATGRGKGFFAVDFFKLGLASSFGPKYTLFALLASNPGAQANNNFANGFELGSPTFQGEALFADVKNIWRDQLDVKVGYFWLPWGREVKGLLRLNPLFNANSLFYKDGFSQAENQTGLFFQTHNRSHIQYGFGLTSGDKGFSLAGATGPTHTGNAFWQRPGAGGASGLGGYGSVQGKYHRFDWDLNYWDNGGEPGVFIWKGHTGGFTWGPHRRLTLMGELGHADITQSTGARAEWDAAYATLVWRLRSDTDAALRYDYATIGTLTTTTRTTTDRTLAVSHRLAEKQTIIADYAHPSSNPGFNPASPVLNPGRDIRDDLFRVSYRLVF